MKQDVNSLLEDMLHQIEKTILPETGESGKERTCRICGCTWEHGCPGGCWWVEPDLCSACASKVHSEETK